MKKEAEPKRDNDRVRNFYLAKFELIYDRYNVVCYEMTQSTYRGIDRSNLKHGISTVLLGAYRTLVDLGLKQEADSIIENKNVQYDEDGTPLGKYPKAAAKSTETQEEFLRETDNFIENLTPTATPTIKVDDSKPDINRSLTEISKQPLAQKKFLREADELIARFGEASWISKEQVKEQETERWKEVRERLKDGEFSEETLASKRLLFAKWLFEHGEVREENSENNTDVPINTNNKPAATEEIDLFLNEITKDLPNQAETEKPVNYQNCGDL